MFKRFTRRHCSILGIDISSMSVKAIQISGSYENRCVDGYGYELLPVNAVEGNKIKDVAAVATCIKKLLLSHAGLSSNFVVLAIPDSLVISKIIQLSNHLSDSEVEEFVIMEAGKYISYPINEINMDFAILSASAKNTAMHDVLIIATKEENVSNRVEVISQVGLEIKVVDVESYAIERIVQLLVKKFPEFGKHKTVIVVDIGAEFTRLYVLYHMRTVYTSEEMFGGRQLIDSISQYYGISYEEAVQITEQKSMPIDYELAIFHPFIEMIALQVKRILQFFFSTEQYSVVDTILLIGDVAKIPNLAQQIQIKTDVPTSVVNPFKYLNVSKNVCFETLSNLAPSLAIACGLALRTGND